ncbi:hypothetical protein HNR31_001789 [Anoxybacillus caldiproteolyticus]|uniref:Uncharacterized protein n=1 Tax=Thermaerobacillus caldiproteolyticus TaxID=247480 RepID=A0A7W0BXX3_9BACL|nr:hypothetical protein [Anoxybacillus caldiproteolyticus]
MFEGRIYLIIFDEYLAAIVVSIIGPFMVRKCMSGSRLKDIVDIEYVEPHFEEAGSHVDNIYIMNIGLSARHDIRSFYGME